LSSLARQNRWRSQTIFLGLKSLRKSQGVARGLFTSILSHGNC
jgi:hypothetical protein